MQDDRDEEDSEDFPPWRELIQVGWALLRPEEPFPVARGQLPQLAATGLRAKDKLPMCFPDSPLVNASLNAAMLAMWGREWLTPEDPGTVPPATTRPRRWVDDYKRRYYVNNDIQEFPLAPPKPSADELTLLRRGCRQMVPVDDVVSLESLSRHALSALGSVDWLFGTLRKLIEDPVPDGIKLEQTWAAATRALRHSTQWNAAAVALSTVLRRKAFLASADYSRLPSRAHQWLQYQPLPTNSTTGLLGETLGKVREMARDEGQSRLLAMASRRQPAHTQKPYDQPFRANPSGSPSQSSRARGFAHRRQWRTRGKSRPSATRTERSEPPK